MLFGKQTRFDKY